MPVFSKMAEGNHLEAPATHAGVGFVRLPWLNVNKLGQRYFKEDIAFAFTCNANMNQPDHSSWVVWDGNWEEETKKLGVYEGRVGKSIYSSFHRTTPELYQKLIKEGSILKAETLEELVQKMGIPSTTFMATVTEITMN